MQQHETTRRQRRPVPRRLVATANDQKSTTSASFIRRGRYFYVETIKAIIVDVFVLRRVPAGSRSDSDTREWDRPRSAERERDGRLRLVTDTVDGTLFTAGPPATKTLVSWGRGERGGAKESWPFRSPRECARGPGPRYGHYGGEGRAQNQPCAPATVNVTQRSCAARVVVGRLALYTIIRTCLTVVSRCT